MSEATVSSKGQVTIPAEIRRFLDVNAQDRLTFTPMPDGTVMLRAKIKTLNELKGMLTPKAGVKVAIEEMNLGDA